MIGRPPRRPALVAIAAIVLLAGLFAAYPGDRAVAPRVGALAGEPRARLAAAIVALDTLSAHLSGAFVVARHAAPRAASGDRRPAGNLGDAVAAVADAEESLGAVLRLVDDLADAAPCASRAAGALETDVTPGQVGRLVASLGSAATRAEQLGALRRGADETLAGLADALAAVDGGDLAAARAGHERATRAFDAMRRPASELADVMPTASVWFETTGALLAGLGGLVDGVARGDPSEAEAGRRLYREAGDGAARADRALAIGLAEASAAAVDPPIAETGRIAVALERAADDLRSVAALASCR